jgi:sarcosine oxidase subunit beta
MATTADVVVVGAGIIGCSVAYRLGETGRRVIVVDAGDRAGSGSTSASSAIVRFHYNLRDNAAMAWDSYHAWTDWPDEIGGIDPTGMIEYRTTGGLLLGELRDLETMEANLRAIGIDHEILTADAIRNRFPAIDPSAFGPPCRLEDPGFDRAPSGDLHGLFTPAAGYVNDPQLAARNYQWAAERLGTEFRYRQRVTGIESTAGRVAGVELADATTIEAATIVNAAGPASDHLNQLAGVADRHIVRSRPLLTETHVVPTPPTFTGRRATLVFDPDLGSAFRPEIGDLVHIATVEPQCDELHWVDDPWVDPGPATIDRYQTQTLRVARRMPTARIPPRPRGLAALYDVTPDWNPLLDSTDLDGYFLACGTSGNSFKTAPTIAQIISHLVDDATSDEHTAAGTDGSTFLTRRTGTPVDLAHYSRNRRSGPSRNVIA